MEKTEKIKKEDLLNREWNKNFEKKVMLQLQIKLQESLDPEEVSARKPLRFAQNGQPISYQDIKRKEHIEMLSKELENVELILKTIESL